MSDSQDSGSQRDQGFSPKEKTGQQQQHEPGKEKSPGQQGRR